MSVMLEGIKLRPPHGWLTSVLKDGERRAAAEAAKKAKQEEAAAKKAAAAAEKAAFEAKIEARRLAKLEGGGAGGGDLDA